MVVEPVDDVVKPAAHENRPSNDTVAVIDGHPGQYEPIGHIVHIPADGLP